MKLEVTCITDVGLRRENNQDFFLFEEFAENLGIYVVADGMGGHSGGEVASRLAAETVVQVVRDFSKKEGSRKPHPRTILTTAYETASQRVFDTSKKPGAGLEGMGTTLVAAFFNGTTIFIANVGDSRGYLFRDNKLWQLTEDHSLVNEQLRAGLITDEEVGRFIGKNVITRSVGFEAEVSVDVIEREVQAGDVYLFCSDGLSGLVEDERISEILRGNKPSEAVAKCVEEAKRNGGDDNVTVMVLHAKSL